MAREVCKAMAELRRLKLAPILMSLSVPRFSDTEIYEMLGIAEYLGFDLGPTSELGELTLAELEILVQETNGFN